jgi:hypothetical protein
MENLIGSRSPIRGDIADPYYSGEVIGRIAAVIGKQPISRGAYLKVKRSPRKAFIGSISSLGVVRENSSRSEPSKKA